MPEFMVEVIDVNNVLEGCVLGEGIIPAECQRVAADTIIIVVQKEFLCFFVIGYG